MCTTSTCPVHRIPNTRNHSHTIQLAKFNSFVLNFIGFVSIQQISHDSINFNIVDSRLKLGMGMILLDTDVNINFFLVFVLL